MNTYESVVHYICESTKECPERLGATKLNKVLWFSDLLSYIETGKSITEETYIKRQYDPVPKNILSVISSLERLGKIARRDESFHGFLQKQLISLSSCDDSFLTEAQRKIIDDIIEKICKNYTASSISELTHDDLWSMAQDGEEIPLYAVFSFKPGEIHDRDIDWANQRIQS